MKKTIVTALAGLAFSLNAFAQELPFEFNAKDKISINTKNYHELLPVISPDGNRMYFAVRNHPKNAGGTQDIIDIWYADKEDGKWSAPKHANNHLNNKDFNFISSISSDGKTIILGNTYGEESKHPGPSVSTLSGNAWGTPKKLKIENFANRTNAYNFNLSRDGKYLLMSIDKAGTVGSRDLFISTKKADGSWSEPKNLGKTINTASKEMTPYLAKDNKTLYFSSNGHGGEGDQDIFVSMRQDDSWTNWSKPVNLGKTVNTAKFDAYFILDADEKTGFLTSEQDGKKDIFSVAVVPVQVAEEEVMPEESEPANPNAVVVGQVKDINTGDPVKAKVDYESKDGDKGSVETDDQGNFKVELPKNKEYTFTTHADHYAMKDFPFTLPEDAEGEVKKDLEIEPVAKVLNLDHVYFDTGKSTIRKESYEELDHAYEVMKTYEGVKFIVGGHTDNTGSYNFNKTLSGNRAKAVRDYLVNKGVDASIISSEGYGPDKPVASNDTDEGRQKNRRVEIVIE